MNSIQATESYGLLSSPNWIIRRLKGEFQVSAHGQTVMLLKQSKAMMQEKETMPYKCNYSLELLLQSFPLCYEPTACE